MKAIKNTVRLNKFIADCGVVSRRKADELILEGRVRINHKVVHELGIKVDPKIDNISVDGKQIVNISRPLYIIFNKPKDCITTTKDERGRTTVLDYVKVKERIFPVGRLDKDTTGALILTNDGQFANKLMHPQNEVKKTYIAKIDKPIEFDDIIKLRRGVKLSDGVTHPADVDILPNSKKMVVGLIIHEGRNRQIHRMFESLGYEIKKLERLAYGKINLEGLKRGQWRFMTKKEIEGLTKLKKKDE